MIYMNHVPSHYYIQRLNDRANKQTNRQSNKQSDTFRIQQNEPPYMM